MSDSKKVIDSLERENSINKDKIQSLQLMAGIYNEQLNSLTTNVYNNPILDTEPGIVESNKAIIVSKDGTIDNLNLTGNIVATNIKNYYQTINLLNSSCANLGFWNGPRPESQQTVTGAGAPSNKDLWKRFESWKTSGSDCINSNTSIFSPQDYGFKALVPGTYKVYVHMAFQGNRTNTNLVIRLAKNALVNDTEDNEKENPGPLSGTSSDIGSTHAGGGIYSAFGSATITHIMNLAAEDQVSVYITNVGVIDPNGNDATARYGYSQFLVEYLGA